MNSKKVRLWVMVAAGVCLVAAVILGIIYTAKTSGDNQALKEQLAEAQLANEQLKLTNEFESISAEFDHYESAAQRLTNDTIYAKYTAARNRVEQLMKELKDEKVKSQKRINELQGEISTLRNLLRHYIAQIDSLSKENQALRQENTQVKSQNEQLTSRVREATAKNEVLTERMTLAEKLNVTGVTLTCLKKNGKTEKNVTKATQLMVTFTIPQNNSTPTGPKTIYLRLTNPEGQLLGNGAHFSFEGGSVASTAQKTVEYSGDEISGITIYWDVNTTLTPGDYTVELFTDGYRLCSRHFTLSK